VTKQTFVHFSQQASGYRALYTMTLLVIGLGYLFAMIQIHSVHAMRDGKPGLSPADLEIAYGGSQADTRLEAAIKGPMSGMLNKEDAGVMITWVRTGAEKEAFQKKVLPIMQEHCLSCHGAATGMRAANPHIPLLEGYDNVMKMVQLDTGVDVFTMVRISHIHLFGMTFIFFILGSIFVHARVHPAWLKSAILVTPFLSILVDILSWYLTKVYRPFAWLTYLSGVTMGLAFVTQWTISIYQLWFSEISGSEHSSGK